MNILQDKVALVTGAGRGIGLAIAQKLASEAAHIVVNDVVDQEQIGEALDSIRQAGAASVSYRQFSVADSAAVNEQIKNLHKEMGHIDILINNAGLSRDGLLMRFKDEDWQLTLDVNLKGAFNCARAVSRPMIKQRWGRIINISSVVGQMGNAGQVAYSANKAGLIGMTKTLARELANRKITVNAVAPGYIDTEMTRALSEELRDGIRSMIPLGEVGQPEDIANAVGFLSSPDSAYITGQVLGVNGGMWM